MCAHTHMGMHNHTLTCSIILQLSCWPEEGIRTRGAGVTDSCEAPNVGDGTKLKSSQNEYYVLLTIVPSLQLLCSLSLQDAKERANGNCLKLALEWDRCV